MKYLLRDIKKVIKEMDGHGKAQNLTSIFLYKHNRKEEGIWLYEEYLSICKYAARLNKILCKFDKRQKED